MLFRIMGEHTYVRCEGTDVGHVADSVVHRFDREIGFLSKNQAAIDADELVRSTYEALRNDPAKTISHEQRVHSNLFSSATLA